MKHEEITSEVIGAFYNVYNKLGYGFLEKVYENALIVELRKNKIYCEKQQQVKVFYKGVEVGNYFADIVVEGVVILELKANKTLNKTDELQLQNYLKATDMEVGLLLNFGEEPEFKRKVFSNKNPI